MRLTRNRSMPFVAVDSTKTLRKSSSNVFSFPTLKLNRTSSSDKTSLNDHDHHHHHDGYLVPQIVESSTPPLFKSRPRASSTSTMPLAPMIACIKRGNFMRLTDLDMDALLRDMKAKGPSTVFADYTLTSLVISEDDAKILSRLIKSSEITNIKTFKLDRCAVSQAAYKVIFEAFQSNKTITSLIIHRSVVNDKIMRFLSKMLIKNNTIKQLDLSNNKITAEGVAHLAEAMIYNRTVTRLCLQSNSIKRAGAPSLASILTKNRVVRHLNIGSNGLGPDGVIDIAEAVKYNRTLRSLSLDLNEMGPQGAKALAKALLTNHHLSHLYLPHNNIGDPGVQDLCQSLHRNVSIVSLDLEFNNIGLNQSVVGMKALADLLKVNKTLLEINLAYNVFPTAESIQALMEGISVNSTLESIMFTSCGISTEGAIAIANVLPLAKGLQNLGLTANPDIAVEGYWALATGLEKNQHLKGIQLDYNSPDRHALYESIQKSLTRNFVWQRSVYMAACKILVLSRIVLLGQPAQQNYLRLYMQEHQQLCWMRQQQEQEQYEKKRKEVGHDDNEQQQKAETIGLPGQNDNHIVRFSLLDSSGIARSMSRPSDTSRFVSGDMATWEDASSSNGNDTGYFLEHELSNNMNHGKSHPQQEPIDMSKYGHSHVEGHTSGLNEAQTHLSLSIYSSHNQEGPKTMVPDVQHHLPLPAAEPRHERTTSVEGYNAHKVMANLVNMPFEIFETICAFLDTEHTMTLAQIRATIRVAGTRSTLSAVYHTRDKMMETIFLSRYIALDGVPYSVRAGDERV
ncbi:hypothetical protein BGZ94_008921 [Podila epigama]|nr:hypothetical protein BGZ94_008921 [Podila epigama]